MVRFHGNRSGNKAGISSGGDLNPSPARKHMAVSQGGERLPSMAMPQIVMVFRQVSSKLEKRGQEKRQSGITKFQWPEEKCFFVLLK